MRCSPSLGHEQSLFTPDHKITRGVALVVFAHGNHSVDAEQPFTGWQRQHVVATISHKDDAAVDIAAAQVRAGLHGSLRPRHR